MNEEVERLKAQLVIARNLALSYRFQNPRVLKYALKNELKNEKSCQLIDLDKAEKAFREADHHGRWVGEEWVIDESIG